LDAVPAGSSVRLKIALVTPYYPIIERHAASYFTDRGYEIVHIEGLKCKSIIEVASQTPERLREAVLAAEQHRPDAILQLGTNLRFAEVAAAMESELKKPVLGAVEGELAGR
jgi:maleate isomerase